MSFDDFLLHYPNNVKKYQRAFIAREKQGVPVHMLNPKIDVPLYQVSKYGCVVVCLLTCVGVYHMATGTGKKQ